METRRSHFIVYSKKKWFLDYIFEKKATKVSYAGDKYILYFKEGIPASRLHNYCGGMPIKIEAVSSRPSKREKERNNRSIENDCAKDTMHTIDNGVLEENPMLETTEKIEIVDSEDGAETTKEYTNRVPELYNMDIVEPNDNAVDYVTPCSVEKNPCCGVLGTNGG